MKVTYDPDRDELRILFSDSPIERSIHDIPGLILDYGSNGEVVGLEITLASQRMSNPRKVEFNEKPVSTKAMEPEAPSSDRELPAVKRL